MRSLLTISLAVLLACGSDGSTDASMADGGEGDVEGVDAGADVISADGGGRYVPPGSCPGATSVPVGSTFCSGVGNTGSMECGVGRVCVPDDPQCPAGCTGPPPECAADSECGAELCQRVRGPATECCVDPYWYTQCAPPCSADEECGDGDYCEDDGRCRPISCVDGNPCPAGRVCDPMRPEGLVDAQGCAVKNCMLDDFVCPPNTACTSTSSLQGGCELIACNATTPCGPNTDCDAPSGACAPRRCAADAECDCGACINTVCAPRAYVCVDE